MADIYDDIFTSDDFHYFIGTKGSDNMVGNGSLSFIMAGGGAHDEINPGIGDREADWDDRGFWTVLYPDGVLAGFGHPASVTYGGSIAQGFGGHNTVHVGHGVWLGGHVDPTKIFFHGPMPDGFGEAVLRVNFRDGDRIVLDNTRTSDSNPNGVTFSQIEGVRTFAQGGDKYVEVAQFEIDSYSKNSSIVKQSALIVTRDTGHPDYDPLNIKYTGNSYTDDVRGYLEDRVAGTSDAPDWII
jgi:hypothetical protein